MTDPDTVVASAPEGRIVVTLDELLYQRRMTLTELAERVDITLANLGKFAPSLFIDQRKEAVEAARAQSDDQDPRPFASGVATRA